MADDTAETIGALPLPAPDDEEPLASTVRAEWTAALGLDDVPGNASFFEVGGHSLAVIRLLARIERQLGVKLAVAEFFDAPTLESFTAAVAARQPRAARGRVRGRL
ncbi:acyl carrier protein [Streptomyces sp. SID12501]|uniref:Acyl carrier protein n=2 Tax=Streptomyces sp. SID12501 TaxID=2706042 RepID=A0A6B3C4H2_9ACTN|nr:acyl carrier protein [Streptomyces sp. SID12501]